MKLLFVIQGLHSGGAERVMSVLCNTFADQGISVILALTEQNNNFAYEINSAVRIVDVTSSSNAGLVSNRGNNIKNLRKLYITEKPDAVISFITRTNICAILAGVGLNTPIIISERNNPVVDPRSRKTRLLRDLLYPLAAGCVFQTEFAMNCFPSKVKRKSKVIFNPVSADIKTVDLNQTRKKRIVSICRLNKQKNIPLLIRSFANICNKYPDYCLEIYGEGEEKESLEEMIKNFGISEKCHLMGHTSHPMAILASSQIFALSSDYEGMPNALIEAMCAGCACVSTDSPAYGARDLICNQENGLLVSVGDEKEFTEALESLLLDDEKREQFGIKARDTIKKVDTNVITEKWLAFIKNKIN